MGTELVKVITPAPLVYGGQILEGGNEYRLEESVAAILLSASQAEPATRIKALRDGVLAGCRILAKDEEGAVAEGQAVRLSNEGLVSILNPGKLSDSSRVALKAYTPPPAPPALPKSEIPTVTLKALKPSLLGSKVCEVGDVSEGVPEDAAAHKIAEGVAKLSGGSTLSPRGQAFLEGLRYFLKASASAAYDAPSRPSY